MIKLSSHKTCQCVPLHFRSGWNVQVEFNSCWGHFWSGLFFEFQFCRSIRYKVECWYALAGFGTWFTLNVLLDMSNIVCQFGFQTVGSVCLNSLGWVLILCHNHLVYSAMYCLVHHLYQIKPRHNLRSTIQLNRYRKRWVFEISASGTSLYCLVHTWTLCHGYFVLTVELSTMHLEF